MATVADIAEMHRVRMSVRENRLSEPGRVGVADYEALLTGAGRGWVARLRGRVVGFAVVDLARSSIWALFVDPAFEGRGIGRRLHDVMIDRVFETGVGEVWLTTDPGTRAEAFYRSAGWKPSAPHPEPEIRLTLSRSTWEARRP